MSTNNQFQKCGLRKTTQHDDSVACGKNGLLGSKLGNIPVKLKLIKAPNKYVWYCVKPFCQCLWYILLVIKGLSHVKMVKNASNAIILYHVTS